MSGGLAQSPGAPTPAPLRRPRDLDNFIGEWVAVKDGVVIAKAPTSRQLVYEVKKLADRGRGAVVQFVAPPSDTRMVGVG